MLALAATCLLAAPPEIDAGRYRSHVEHLASDDLRGRGGADSRIAAEYVAARFAEIGLEPLYGEDFIKPIFDPDGPEIGENVGGLLPGTGDAAGEYVLVTAHHDHLGTRGDRIYNGANDNATGAAMVIEVARALKDAGCGRTLVFISFGLEERMLWGSRTFVSDPPIDLSKIRLFITADMLGRPLGGLPMSDVFVIGAESVAIDGESPTAFADRIDAFAAEIDRPTLRIGADIVGTRSDYGPFRDKDVPFVFFSTGENPDYHRPSDVAETIDYDMAVGNARLIAAVARDAASTDESFAWSTDRPADIAEAKTLRRVTDLLLAEAEAGRRELPVVERVLVQQVNDRAKAVVNSGEFSAADRALFKRAAQALLLSVF